MTTRIDGTSLTLEDLGRVARGGSEVVLTPEAAARIDAARALVETAGAGSEAIYGINTGFGDLAQVRIPPEKTRQLQERLLVSHAAGVGEPLSDEVVRAMLLLRANTLARGHSGPRREVVERLLELLRRDLLPVVPSRGSVGASGDLAPLAHLALPVIGRGRLRHEGRVAPARVLLQEHGLEPLALEIKEGLALINGTQAMTALLALACLESRRMVRAADLIGALSTDALRGADTPFDPRIHALRPHPGQQASAGNLWRLLSGSEIRESHRFGDVRVQDPYSLRCMPQVHGAAREALGWAEGLLAREMNAVTDNPLVFADDAEILSGGNFHGQPVALAADVLAIGIAELGSISERRTEKLTTAAASGLPAFLVEEPGVNSGFMIAQVTAAALVAENKLRCHPASVDTIPTSAGREDHVSMGMSAALKANEVVRDVRRILAIELLAAAQGLDLLRPYASSPPLQALHRDLRRRVPRWDEDREMAPDLEAADLFLAGAVDSHLAGLD